MAEKIKKFFAKKKTDAKFKLAGPGHRLDSDSSSTVSASSKNSKTAYAPQKSVPSEAKRQAAEAALSRLQNQKKDSPFNTSLAAIQAQVRKELESERKELDACQQGVTQAPVLCEMEASPLLAVKGVYFRCPIISEEVLSKEEWRDKIKEFLMEQLEEERGLTACLMIHSCNYNKTKVTECVNVISKYLENIIANPQELKFHKIRCSNNTYREKVEPILGATDLLFAAGFRQEILANNDVNEQFWVFNESNIEGLETLEFLRDALRSEDRIELIIDRNLQVLSPAQAAKRVELPSDFYALTPDDLKKEQQVKSELVEKQLQLRTKVMREKDELREIRKYKFAIIRVRFPDGLYLQGTFSVYEKFSEVTNFIEQNLDNSTPLFHLYSPTGHRLEESDKTSTLVDLRLVPATILSFQWDPLISDEMAKHNSYLKPEVMMLLQPL